MLFAQKRFFRIVSLELLKRLLRLMEPIRELEMLRIQTVSTYIISLVEVPRLKLL